MVLYNKKNIILPINIKYLNPFKKQLLISNDFHCRCLHCVLIIIVITLIHCVCKTC